MGAQNYAPAALPPGRRAVTLTTGDGVGPRAGVEG